MESSPNTCVVRREVLERRHLLIGEDQGSGLFVIAVGPQHLHGLHRRIGQSLVGQLLDHVIGRQPQGLGRVVRAQVAAMTEDGAVLPAVRGARKVACPAVISSPVKTTVPPPVATWSAWAFRRSRCGRPGFP